MWHGDILAVSEERIFSVRGDSLRRVARFSGGGVLFRKVLFRGEGGELLFGFFWRGSGRLVTEGGEKAGFG